MRKCKVCGGEIEATKYGHTIYCGAICRNSFHNSKRPKIEYEKKAKCPNCETVFEKKRFDHVYCTKSCGDIYRNRKRNRATGKPTGRPRKSRQPDLKTMYPLGTMKNGLVVTGYDYKNLAPIWGEPYINRRA